MLRIVNLSVYCGEKYILKDINLEIQKGKTAIVGSSGAGKTTLLKAIASILPKSLEIKGNIFLNGCDILKLPIDLRYKRRYFNYLPQESGALFDPLTKIKREIVSLPTNWFDNPKRILESYPPRLSGGELQRVALFFVLSQETVFTLLDEPVNFLDYTTREVVVDSILQSRKNLVIATHDPKLIRRLDRVAVIDKGELIFKSSLEETLNRFGKVEDFLRYFLSASKDR